MRLLPLSFLSLLSLAGCPEPTDPDLAKPCGQRRAASVLVGTGSDQFQPIPADGLLIQTGPQGGNHIWMAFACRGLGPTVGVSYGIKELSTGTDVTGTLDEVDTLQYDPASDTDQVAGIRGFFALEPTDAITDPSQLVGKTVMLWADVTDSCSLPAVHGEAQGKVTGFAD
jgi:hypothetical protein